MCLNKITTKVQLLTGTHKNPWSEEIDQTTPNDRQSGNSLHNHISWHICIFLYLSMNMQICLYVFFYVLSF